MSTHAVLLERGMQTTCAINLHGGNISSWKINGKEQIFVSRRAIFDGKMAIRGGIQVFFPHFGQWNIGPQHGFARLTPWEIVVEPHRLDEGDIEIVLKLTQNTFSKSMWNFKFALYYTVVLRERDLTIHVDLRNHSEATMHFNLVLQAYLKVEDATNCKLINVKDLYSMDKLRYKKTSHIDFSELPLANNIDKILLNTHHKMTLVNAQEGKNITITKENFPDMIVFHPSEKKGTQYDDMDVDEYNKMICLGVGRIQNQISLPFGEKFEADFIIERSERS